MDDDELAKTKTSFLYKKVLGEVDEIVKRVETLESTLQAVGQAAADRIAAAANDKLAQIQQGSDVIRAEIEGYGEKQLEDFRIAARDLASVIRNEVHNGVVTGAAAAFDVALEKKIEKAVDRVAQAENGMPKKLDTHLGAMHAASKVLRDAAASVKPTAAARIVGAIAIFLAVAFGIVAGYAMKNVLFGTDSTTAARRY